MTILDRSKRIAFDIQTLHPVMITSAKLLIADLNKKTFEDGGEKFRLEPFEGYRSPMRQNHLFAHTKATKAREWQSGHQYGLAMDFACVRVDKITNEIIPGKWFWADGSHSCWRELKRLANIGGLTVPISWDYGHVEHPLFHDVLYALRKNEWNWIA